MTLDSSRTEVSPRQRPGPWARLYALLVSPKLAIVLLVVVLGCCIAGVTIWRYEEARAVIFSTLWFNALLVLLAVSSATAFFSRMWKRKLTLLSVGMIVFHLSFAGLLGGAAYNSLYRFRGLLRLTEGETLPNGDPRSYDYVERGRFFDFRRLRGETTLHQMHTKYEVDGQDKRAAYDISVGETGSTARETIYITRGIVHDGVRYLPWHEGYSVLLVMTDERGEEIFGGHVPLQSLRQPDGGYVYTSGRSTGAASFRFPPAPEQARAELRVTYRPSSAADRAGEVTFKVRPVGPDGEAGPERSGRVVVGYPFDAGAIKIEPREIRFWVTMEVSVNPGLDLILGSLCAGLGGMALIFVGRMRQGGPRKPARPGTIAAHAGEGLA